MSDDEPGRCGGTGMVAYWDGSAYAGEMCRGCVDCEGPDEWADGHDTACEAELTSHGYTPCRCEERAKKRAGVADASDLLCASISAYEAGVKVCICEIDRHDFNCLVHNDIDHPKRGPNGDE